MFVTTRYANKQKDRQTDRQTDQKEIITTYLAAAAAAAAAVTTAEQAKQVFRSRCSQASKQVAKEGTVVALPTVATYSLVVVP